MEQQLKQAAEIINNAGYTAAFTGAGISVESGIPPFRGDDGIWSKYDPSILELHTYLTSPEKVWPVIRKLFFNYFAGSKPNAGHLALAQIEKMGKLDVVITQNIDNLHQEAGSKDVIEFHGNSKTFICTAQSEHVHPAADVDFDREYPRCPTCGKLSKPSFIFFGEPIPSEALVRSRQLVNSCDVMIIIGSTGEVFPAGNVPIMAKRNGAKIIEVNPAPSAFTYNITDVMIKGKAGEILSRLTKMIS